MSGVGSINNVSECQNLLCIPEHCLLSTSTLHTSHYLISTSCPVIQWSDKSVANWSFDSCKCGLSKGDCSMDVDTSLRELKCRWAWCQCKMSVDRHTFPAYALMLYDLPKHIACSSTCSANEVVFINSHADIFINISHFNIDIVISHFNVDVNLPHFYIFNSNCLSHSLNFTNTDNDYKIDQSNVINGHFEIDFNGGIADDDSIYGQ